MNWQKQFETIQQEMERITLQLAQEREKEIFNQAKRVRAIKSAMLICSKKNAAIIKDALNKAGIINVEVIVTDLCEDDKCYMYDKDAFKLI